MSKLRALSLRALKKPRWFWNPYTEYTDGGMRIVTHLVTSLFPLHLRYSVPDSVFLYNYSIRPKTFLVRNWALCCTFKLACVFWAGESTTFYLYTAFYTASCIEIRADSEPVCSKIMHHFISVKSGMILYLMLLRKVTFYTFSHWNPTQSFNFILRSQSPIFIREV